MRFSAIMSILRKEWGELFFSPIAYIISVLYLLITGVFFFLIFSFFLRGAASMQLFFAIAPYILSFTVAALSMRLYSEEIRSGTFEVLNTLPYRPVEILLGKYLAITLFVVVLQLLTLSYPLTLSLVGSFDMGEIVVGYIGLLLLNCSYSAIGVFCSTLSDNPINSFFLTFTITLFLALLGLALPFLPEFLAIVIAAINSSSHIDRLSQGVLDLRDVVYFLSVTFIALFAAWQMATKER